MDEVLRKEIEEAEKADGFFITISRRNGEMLRHWQWHSHGFGFDNLAPSMAAVRKLAFDKYRPIDEKELRA